MSKPAIPRSVTVIGAGPAGLMAAEVLAQGGANVVVYDAMPSAGRKFLMAGRGGLNLTHSEPFSQFMARFGAAQARLTSALESSTPQALRDWSHALGQPTFVGSSGRVFPESFKASPLLRAWLRRLGESGVRFVFRHRWLGWDNDARLLWRTPAESRATSADAVVLALGGASWPRLGSDGAWAVIFEQRGVAISPLRPANCGFVVKWSDVFLSRFEGQPLKNVGLSFGAHRSRGDLVITRTGLEGGALYAISAQLRDALAESAPARLHIALRGNQPRDALLKKLSIPRGKQSVSTFLRKALGLSAIEVALLQEAAHAGGLSLSALPPERLAEMINSVAFDLLATSSIDRAISTAGGIAFDEFDDRFMLKRMPGIFVAGEMLDWEAPTGGYLLQACFATGAAAGRGALAWLKRN